MAAVFAMIVSFFSWLCGKASIAFHHASETLTIPNKNGEKTELADLVEKITPPCWLNPFLFNGHMQTLWALLKYNNPPVVYKRKVFEASNPAFAGSFAVDFVVHEKVETAPDLSRDIAYYTDEELENLGSDDTRPMLVCQHGLSGGSHEIYLRHVVYAVTSIEGQGRWEACVINFRGCAGSKITTDILYNARATWDIRQLVKWLHEKFPNRPLYGIGFSIGANIMTNYVGEEGDKCTLRAAVSISNPYNLEIVDHGLRSSFIGWHVYTTALGAAMREVVYNNREVLKHSERFDYNKVINTNHLFEFDREVQCPTWGYPTEGAYYRDASSIDALLAVRIPFFGLHAEDDPITLKDAVPYAEVQQNPFVVLCCTSTGGHLSWFELGGTRWYVKPIVGFLKAMQEADTKALNENKRELIRKIRDSAEHIDDYLETRPRFPYFHDPL